MKKWMIGCFLLGSWMTGAAVAEKSSYPNILMIVVDDLRPQLGCYGYPETHSPHMDRLASEGTLFETAYVQVPVCGASRASMMTGLYPTASRFVTYYSSVNVDTPSVVDIPGYLRRFGYTTISNGKIYHQKDDCTNSWNEISRPDDFRVYLKAENQKLKGNQQAAYESADVPDDAYPSGKMVNKIMGDLQRAHASGEPFFITAGFTKPHLPFNAPKKYWDLYDRDSLAVADNPFAPKGAPSQSLHQWNELRDGYGGMPPEGPVSDELARTLIHGYYACVSYTDKLIGDLLDELERLEMDEETIVILIGDHGWQLGEHALWCKHALFETSLHTPMIIKAPGFTAGQRSKALVEFVDLYPTICELAGLEQPYHLQGKSLVNVMKNPKAAHKPAIFARYHGGETVRTPRFQYSEWQGGAAMFYDHQLDPDENINRLNNPTYAKAIARLKELLVEHRKRL